MAVKGYNRHALTDVGIRNKIRTAKASGQGATVSDGHGLNLLITKDGAAYWRHSYRFEGKQKHVRLGVYPALGLADARVRHGEQRQSLQAGLDPASLKREAKEAAKRTAAQARTFKEAADAWFADYKKPLDAKYAAVIERRIDKWFASTLGPMKLEDIDGPKVLAALKPIESQGSIDLAWRMKIIAGQVFGYAVAHGWIKHDPSQSINRALAPRPKARHRAKIKEADLPDFFERLAAYDGYPITKLALRFILHTAVRTDELRFAEWSEIEGLDGASPLWRIPPERMKMDREHLVPLTPQVVAILKEARVLYPKSKLIFPSEESRSGVMSENAMLYALYYLGYKGKATVHGLRGTFSTVLNENDFTPDWIELQLSHAEEDEVRGAYNSAQWLKQRRNMMIWWSNFLQSKATTIRQAA